MKVRCCIAISLLGLVCVGGAACVRSPEQRPVDELQPESVTPPNCVFQYTQKKWYPIVGNFCDDLYKCSNGKDSWSGWHSC